MTKPSYYEPQLNRTYEEMGDHYGTAILPARRYRPRDKAKVEVGVQIVPRLIVMALRQQRFFALGELNAAIAKRLAQPWNDLREEENTKPLTDVDHSLTMKKLASLSSVC